MKKFKEFINEEVDNDFEEIKKKYIEKEIEIAQTQDIPNRESYIKRCLQLELIQDPKEFVKKYMRLNGATKWDLPDELYRYL